MDLISVIPEMNDNFRWF